MRASDVYSFQQEVDIQERGDDTLTFRGVATFCGRKKLRHATFTYRVLKTTRVTHTEETINCAFKLREKQLANTWSPVFTGPPKTLGKGMVLDLQVERNKIQRKFKRESKTSPQELNKYNNANTFTQLNNGYYCEFAWF